MRMASARMRAASGRSRAARAATLSSRAGMALLPEALEAGGEVLDLGRGQEGHDHVHLLVGLARDVRAEALQDARAHLGADVGGEAVQVERVLREAHPPL